jgi:hypothetical protein
VVSVRRPRESQPLLVPAVAPHVPPVGWVVFRDPELPFGEGAFFDPSRPVFTDGSCVSPAVPWLAQATAAAVQITGDGKVDRILSAKRLVLVSMWRHGSLEPTSRPARMCSRTVNVWSI